MGSTTAPQFTDPVPDSYTIIAQEAMKQFKAFEDVGFDEEQCIYLTAAVIGKK